MKTLTDYTLAIRTAGSPPAPEGVTTFDLVPADGDVASSTIAALRASDLTPTHFPSRAIFLAPAGSDCLVLYAALCGFADGRVDAYADGVVLELSQQEEAGAALPDAGRYQGHLPWAQVGGPTAEGIPTVRLDGAAPEQVDPEAVTVIWDAARLRMVPPPSARDALTMFVLVAALRWQKYRSERFPHLSTGAEPVPVTKEDPDQGIELEKVRREAWAYRQELLRRSRNRGPAETVPAVPVSVPNKRLAEADADDIQTVLLRLGALHDEGQMWHCPRIGRHRHRDEKPSLKVSADNRARCHRCDIDKVGPVGLVVDVLGVTPDEAARFVLDSDHEVDMNAAGPVGTAAIPSDPDLADSLVGTAVTARVRSVGPDGYDCVVADVATGQSLDAVLPRADAYSVPEGEPPPRIEVDDTVIALVADVQKEPQRLVLSVTASEVVERVLAGYVEELLTGKVVIKRVLRVAGDRAKIVVAPTVAGVSARGACLGSKGSRVQRANTLLHRGVGTGNEQLQIIDYSSDRVTLLANAIQPATAADILVDRGYAVVSVQAHEYDRAVGSKGLNAQLAGQLTGFYVGVVIHGNDLREALDRLKVDKARDR